MTSPRDRFVNPIGEGADPSVVRDGDRFLWCQAEGNVGVSIWVSDRLTSMGTKHVVWTADAEGPCSKEVWAPELPPDRRPLAHLLRRLRR